MSLKYRFNNETPLPTGTGASTADDEKDAVPAGLTRKGEGRMKKKELQRIMSGLITDAQSIAMDEQQADRIKLSAYYNGEPFGTEEEGRSQIVVTEVRDQVLGAKPGLMRIFFAPEAPCEFMPRTEAGVAGAKQATAYVNHVFQNENPGWRLANDLLDDGLIRRLGIVRWCWEEGETTAHEDEDLTLDELFDLVARDDVTPTLITGNGKDGDEYRATVEYTVEHEGCVRLYALPQEEFMFDREATSIEDATMVGHGRHLTEGDLLALGIEQDEIDEHGGPLASLEFSAEKQQRNENTSAQTGGNPDGGQANKLHFYAETYVKVDVDGDGKRELRKICVLGPAFHIVSNKPADERPFAIFTPIPEAHAMIGMGLADLVMDLQFTKSHLTRGMLDSFALSIYPRVAFVEGLVSVEDLLNTEIGAPVRTKRADAVQPFKHDFTGRDALPLIEYFDQVGENRTGRNKGAMSLDADALQSSTQGAVQAALTAAQERTEYFARQAAEQLFKPMFMGIYRLMVKYKPKKALIKLRGEYIPIDVAVWDADYSVYVNVALGSSLPEQRIARLGEIAAKQEQIITSVGADNPLVSLAQLRHTYARILELSGERDVSAFFKPIPDDYTPPAPPAPPPTPEHELAMAQIEVEKQKSIKDIAIKQAELDLKTRKQEFDENFAVAKLAQESTLRRYAIDAQFQSQYTQLMEQLDAAADEKSIRFILDARKQQHAESQAAAQNTLQAAGMQHDANMQDSQQQHEQNLQDTAPAPAQGA